MASGFADPKMPLTFPTSLSNYAGEWLRYRDMFGFLDSRTTQALFASDNVYTRRLTWVEVEYGVLGVFEQLLEVNVLTGIAWQGEVGRDTTYRWG